MFLELSNITYHSRNREQCSTPFTNISKKRYIDQDSSVQRNTSERGNCCSKSSLSWFLGAFARLQKSDYQLRHARLSVYTSVSMEKLGSHWADFQEILHWSIFRKTLEKLQVSLKSDRNILHEDQWTFIIIPRSILIRKEMFRKKKVEKKHTFMFSNIFSSKNVPFVRMWKNTVELGRRPEITIWRTRIACWITKATDIHSEYAVLITFPLQQRLYGSISMLRYTRGFLTFFHLRSPWQPISINRTLHISKMFVFTRVVPKVMSNFFCIRTGNSRRRRVRW